MRNKLLAALVAATAMAATAPAGAFGAIACTNNGGNTPPGQQGDCTGQGLHNENPAGHAPPGQNK